MPNMNGLYPLALTPRLVEALWGGNALVTRYGKAGDVTAKIGESWECWNDDLISNGTHAGKSLSEVLRKMGPALVGLAPLADRTSFPILTKIIDAHQSLSVQVHPDDAYAKRVEREPNGKTECWVILEAVAGAELILGFAKDTDAQEYRRRVEDGTLGEILRRVPVQKGDVFHIPAGTLHAIGAGIVLFETQQTSATTYRIFDWNRVDTAGKARELQIDKAADVLDFRQSHRQAVQPLSYQVQGMKRTLLVADARFGVESLEIAQHGRYITEAVANIFFTHETEVRLGWAGQEMTIAPWQSVLVPAGIDRVEFFSSTPTKIFAITPPGADLRARKRLENIKYSAGNIDAFLAQF